MKQYTQYCLLDDVGEPAMNCHQDDSEDPIVADTIAGLISQAAEWSDVGDEDFLEMLEDPDSEVAGYTIVREVVTRSELTDAEKEILEKLRDEDDEDDEDE